MLTHCLFSRRQVEYSCCWFEKSDKRPLFFFIIVPDYLIYTIRNVVFMNVLFMYIVPVK